MQVIRCDKEEASKARMPGWWMGGRVKRGGIAFYCHANEKEGGGSGARDSNDDNDDDCGVRRRCGSAS